MKLGRKLIHFELEQSCTRYGSKNSKSVLCRVIRNSTV